MAKRGPKVGSGVSGGAAIGKLGGRPKTKGDRKELRLQRRIGLRRRMTDGTITPIELGTLVEFQRDKIVIQLDDGNFIDVYL